MNKVPMTVLGEKKLRDELEHLKKVERPRIIEAISEARKHGDLKENAEYHAAREQQGFIEGRIQDIESKLSNLQVIDITKLENKGKVVFGATVTIMDIESEKTVRYHIVGDDESDVAAGKISVNSPIARAMIGKEVGDVATVRTPSGLVEYEVVKVDYI